MTVTWTPEQVLTLSPDDASRKNASGLANPRKWRSLYQGEDSARDHLLGRRSVIWGEYQGTGADPYRCQVILDQPAFQCSCPSTKSPCKHSLGLLLLYAGQPAIFEAAPAPDWVAAWLARRAALEGRRAVREKQPPDPLAQARRAAARDQKIRAGLDELEIWLLDLLRQGLAAAQIQPHTFWETMAARLVDAQAPGLARIVREDMVRAVSSGEGWHERLLDAVSRLYLALEGYRHLDSLPEAVQADLRALVGITLKQEEVLQGSGLWDSWLVLGREVVEETQLLVQRVWLWGQSSRRPAVHLSFSAPGSQLDGSLPPGLALPGELVFYPGAYPLRALVRRHGQPRFLAAADISGCASLVDALGSYAAALSAAPWLDRFPLVLDAVTPLHEDEAWWLADSDGRRLPLVKPFSHGWSLLAMSGGGPLGVFGTWDGSAFTPLSAWSEGEFVSFKVKNEAAQS